MTVEKLNNEIDEVTEEVHELLAGYRDKDGNLHREFEVIEMTGADEEAISKPDVKNNGSKIVRTILERCCTRIGTFTKKSLGPSKWKDLIQNLYVGDQDYMMLKIREISIGREFEGTHTCPNPDCKVKLRTIIGTEELPIIPFKEEFEIEFELPRGYTDKHGVVHRIGKLRLPIGLDRELIDPVARKNLGEANTLMITRCIIEFNGVKITNELIRDLSRKDRDYLLSLLKDNMFGIDLETDVVCDSCGTEFKASLNMANFI